jgi:hypothetical protein
MLPADTKRRFGRDPDALDARESSLESRAKRYAKSLGYWVRKFQSPGKRSAPDDIFANPFGFVFFIEFKARNKPPTANQLEEHAEMRAHGLTVYVVDNYADACAILDRHCLD